MPMLYPQVCAIVQRIVSPEGSKVAQKGVNTILYNEKRYIKNQHTLVVDELRLGVGLATFRGLVPERSV